MKRCAKCGSTKALEEFHRGVFTRTAGSLAARSVATGTLVSTSHDELGRSVWRSTADRSSKPRSGTARDGSDLPLSQQSGCPCGAQFEREPATVGSRRVCLSTARLTSSSKSWGLRRSESGSRRSRKCWTTSRSRSGTSTGTDPPSRARNVGRASRLWNSGRKRITAKTMYMRARDVPSADGMTEERSKRGPRVSGATRRQRRRNRLLLR